MLVVILAEVLLHLRQLVPPDFVVKVSTDEFLIDAKSSPIEVIYAFNNAPWSPVQADAIQVFLRCISFPAQVETEDLTAETTSICIHSDVMTLLVLLVDVLDGSLAVFPRPRVVDLARGDW